MAPMVEDVEMTRPVFRRAHEMVRVGTAIFGERNYANGKGETK